MAQQLFKKTAVVSLTDEELYAKTVEMINTYGLIEVHENNLKMYKDSIKHEIESCEKHINLIKDCIMTKKEERTYSCYRRKNYKNCTIEWVDVDSGAIVAYDNFEPEDYQEAIPLIQEEPLALPEAVGAGVEVVDEPIEVIPDFVGKYVTIPSQGNDEVFNVVSQEKDILHLQYEGPERHEFDIHYTRVLEFETTDTSDAMNYDQTEDIE